MENPVLKLQEHVRYNIKLYSEMAKITLTIMQYLLRLKENICDHYNCSDVHYELSFVAKFRDKKWLSRGQYNH